MNMSKQKVSFLGLGAMGYPMAGFLVKKGYEVTVFNRTTAKAEKWADEYSSNENPAKFAATPEEAVADADIVFTCLGNDNDVREVFTKIFASAKTGALLVDHTTTSPSLAQELYAEAQKHNMEFLDAPVSGGQAGAEQGILTIMAGGDQTSFDNALDAMNSYAKATTLIGSSGKGQALKMVNQLCITGILQGLSEAWSMAKAVDIDAKMMVDVLQHGAAGSWQMVNRTETAMNNEFDFGFAIDWMRKDLAICFDEAEKLGVDLPLAKQVDEKYAELQDRGYSRSDTSVLVKQFDNEKR
ncbi:MULTISPECIES: NAD(P)-dependent oxidoreductase [unclassified Cocleimonas]|uniref:NAD(P)-dependent oxidoreductase n=1 Tax=unclassified Cocleimonas TaxID=2639732 RepID=UPI002DBE89C0|nr:MULTISPECIES: NAD(P)-dependent oxidoreductase [unclassified Cocleimonas]